MLFSSQDRQGHHLSLLQETLLPLSTAVYPCFCLSILLLLLLCLVQLPKTRAARRRWRLLLTQVGR